MKDKWHLVHRSKSVIAIFKNMVFRLLYGKGEKIVYNNPIINNACKSTSWRATVQFGRVVTYYIEDPGSNPKGKMGQKYAMLFLKTKPYFFHFSSVPKLFTQEFIYDNCGQSYTLQL